MVSKPSDMNTLRSSYALNKEPKFAIFTFSSRYIAPFNCVGLCHVGSSPSLNQYSLSYVVETATCQVVADLGAPNTLGAKGAIGGCAAAVLVTDLACQVVADLGAPNIVGATGAIGGCGAAVLVADLACQVVADLGAPNTLGATGAIGGCAAAVLVADLGASNNILGAVLAVRRQC